MRLPPEILKEAIKKGAVTVGRGYKEVGGTRTEDESIVFGVPKKVHADQILAEAFHKFYDGVPSDVKEVGIVRALDDPTLRYRPCPGGVSVGHVDITAGTLGCWVKKDGQWMMLSNNHVLANSNEAEIGDTIIQPGSYDDGRSPQDDIAHLVDYVPIHFIGEQSGCKYSQVESRLLNARNAMLGRKTRYEVVVPEADYNLVDCAVAKPIDDALVDNTILNITGPINGIVHGELGMEVAKNGRTTGLTAGVITQVDVVTQVSYGAGKIAIFEDQILIEGADPFSAGGDSGSAILEDNSSVCGLLFAGSDTVTIGNRIENVVEALGIVI